MFDNLNSKLNNQNEILKDLNSSFRTENNLAKKDLKCFEKTNKTTKENKTTEEANKTIVETKNEKNNKTTEKVTKTTIETINKEKTNNKIINEDIKEKIKKIALGLFKKISYSKTSVSNIANKAGIGKGTVYLYYKSKEDIIYEIVREKIEETLEKSKDYYLNKNISLKDKIETMVDFMDQVFVEIKDLMFGSFEDLEGKILKEVFKNYSKYIDLSIDFFIEVLKNHIEIGNIEILTEKIKEFINYIIGRKILYVLGTDWTNMEKLKQVLKENCYKIFEAIVLENSSKTN